MELKTFIFIGRSGCGKGTQAELLMDYIKKDSSDEEILYVETGQRFREFLKEDSHTSKLSNEIYNAGGLQPSFLAINMWSIELRSKFKGNEHLVFDGTPRKLNEAYILDEALEFYKRENVHVIYLNVSREWSKEKLLSRGRVDDNTEEIGKRLDWFDKDVLPIIDYYKNDSKQNLVNINGERSIEEIHEDIIQRVFS